MAFSDPEKSVEKGEQSRGWDEDREDSPSEVLREELNFSSDPSILCSGKNMSKCTKVRKPNMFRGLETDPCP